MGAVNYGCGCGFGVTMVTSELGTIKQLRWLEEGSWLGACDGDAYNQTQW